MRVALLVVILALASLGWNWDARAEFNCFETPGEGSRCACIGANDCTEMKSSDNCKSEAACSAECRLREEAGARSGAELMNVRYGLADILGHMNSVRFAPESLRGG